MFFNNGRKKRQEPGTDPDDFVPIFFFELNPTEEQVAMCGGNENCVFDLVVTNDTEFAERTLNEEKEANETIDLFGMFLLISMGLNCISFNYNHVHNPKGKEDF